MSKVHVVTKSSTLVELRVYDSNWPYFVLQVDTCTLNYYSLSTNACCVRKGQLAVLIDLFHLHLHIPIMYWAPLKHTRTGASYRHVTRDVKSCASKTGVYGRP